MDALQAKILTTALATLGESEKAGSASNPKILEWIRAWLPRATDDSATAWCAVWMAEIMTRCGLPVPADPFRARSWLRWGTVVAPLAAEPGDVAILTRPSSHHVALVLRVTPQDIWLLGGNQGDAVSVRAYPFDRVVSVRRA